MRDQLVVRFLRTWRFGGAGGSAASRRKARDHGRGLARLVDLGWRKPKKLGYPHEAWTTQFWPARP
jgi:hypothetical protein